MKKQRALEFFSFFAPIFNTNSIRNVKNYLNRGKLSRFGHALSDVSRISASELFRIQLFLGCAEFKTDKCVCSLPVCCFFHSFFRLKPRPSRNNSVRTFRFPLVRNLRKPKSFFNRPNALFT